MKLRRHNKQVKTYRRGKFLETTARSILGLIDVYNMLPQAIFDIGDIQTFQATLQGVMKNMARIHAPNWEIVFSPRHALYAHPLVKLLNGVVTTNDCDTGEYNVQIVRAEDYPCMTTELGDRDVSPSWW